MKARDYFKENKTKSIRFEHGNFLERPLDGTGEELLKLGKYLDDEINVLDEDETSACIESLF